MVDPRALGAGLERDDDRFANMTPEERLELFLELCELTDAIVRDRPDAGRVRAPHPRSPESEALWERLMASARRDRPGT